MMGFACNGFNSMGFMGGGMWLYGIIFLLIIVAAVYLISNNNRHNNRTTALEILDQEYAKGNITEADYKVRKENLKK